MYLETASLKDVPRTVAEWVSCPPMEGLDTGEQQARVSGVMERTDRGVLLAGSLSCTVGVACSRCMSIFPLRVESKFSLLYRAGGSAEENQAGAPDLELTREDCAEVSLDEEGRIPVMDLVREQIYLSVPMKPVCRQDCKGLCSHCGLDLNRRTCACSEVSIDPRLAPLAQLKKQV